MAEADVDAEDIQQVNLEEVQWYQAALHQEDMPCRAQHLEEEASAQDTQVEEEASCSLHHQQHHTQ